MVRETMKAAVEPKTVALATMNQLQRGQDQYERRLKATDKLTHSETHTQIQQW